MDGGWRLPAAEIERSVAAAAQSILNDQQTMISAIEEPGSTRAGSLRFSKSAKVLNQIDTLFSIKSPSYITSTRLML